MKKKILIFIIIFVAALAGLGAYFYLSGEGESVLSKKELTPSADAQEVLGDAEKLLKEAKHIGTKAETVYYYNDDSEEKESREQIFDRKKKIIWQKDGQGEDEEQQYFYTKEGKKYYVYLEDAESGWIRYSQDAEDSDTDPEYKYWEDEMGFSFSEDEGFSNVKYSNEGEEKLDGTDTVKLKIEADYAYESMYEFNEEDLQPVTREFILIENDWTEEEVAMVDGFSEILDAYVEASQTEQEPSVMKYVQYVWVDKAEHHVLKSQVENTYNEETGKKIAEAVEAYNDTSWEVDLIHQNLSAGATKEEALELLKEEKADMESDDEDMGEMTEPEKVVSTYSYLWDEECPDMEELPKEYKEISEEDYIEGNY